MRLLAHRGDWRNAAENSLAALLAAATQPGLEGVEFDVRLAADGTPVVTHDADLRRVQGRDGLVETLDATALAGLGVASLAEVLAALPTETYLDIEVKVPVGPDFVEICRGGRGDSLDRAAISSFHPEVLAAIAQLAPDWPRWLNALELGPATVEVALGLGCRAVAVEWHALERRAVGRARAAGLGVVAWTVTSPAVLARLESLGVMAACIEGETLAGLG
jgi:glycerophosphoryl diester phosphodiesterase